MLLKLSKMLLMNLTEGERLIGVISLIDASFIRFSMYQLERGSFITAETGEQCMKSVQSTTNKKITRLSLTP